MAQDLDNRLLALLKENARESIADLARKLGVSRATVKQHMATLERRRVIEGYTIRYHPQRDQQQIRAYLMIELNPKQLTGVVRHMEKISAVQSLYSISGIYDLMAQVSCDNTEQLDRIIDQIASLDGIDKTLTSVVLGAKFQR